MEPFNIYFTKGNYIDSSFNGKATLCLELNNLQNLAHRTTEATYVVSGLGVIGLLVTYPVNYKLLIVFPFRVL